jgi:prophage DNA circulation protein
MEYRSASFRGIEFKISGNRNWTSGRRLQIHEYPNRDIPYAEDLGKKSESYSIKAFVIGEDYRVKRDELRKACLDGGIGTLIHPDYGSIEVRCDSISVNENSEQRGMAVFDLVFIEAGEKAVPVISSDLSSSVIGSAEKLLSATMKDFSKNFARPARAEEITKLTENISDNFLTILNNISTGFDYDTKSKQDTVSIMNKITDTISLANQLKNNADNLLNTPSELVLQLNTVMSVIQSLVDNQVEAFRTIRNLNINTKASEKISNSDVDEKYRTQQLEQMTKQIAITKEAETIPNIVYNNADEAKSTLESFLTDVEEIELFEDIEPSNEILQYLKEIKETVIKYIREMILRLPHIKEVKLTDKTPSLVLAYDLYQDLSRADEICKRNKIQYPAFIPANKELKVLTE